MPIGILTFSVAKWQLRSRRNTTIQTLVPQFRKFTTIVIIFTMRLLLSTIRLGLATKILRSTDTWPVALDLRKR